MHTRTVQSHAALLQALLHVDVHTNCMLSPPVLHAPPPAQAVPTLRPRCPPRPTRIPYLTAPPATAPCQAEGQQKAGTAMALAQPCPAVVGLPLRTAPLQPHPPHQARLTHVFRSRLL